MTNYLLLIPSNSEESAPYSRHIKTNKLGFVEQKHDKTPESVLLKKVAEIKPSKQPKLPKPKSGKKARYPKRKFTAENIDPAQYALMIVGGYKSTPQKFFSQENAMKEANYLATKHQESFFIYEVMSITC